PEMRARAVLQAIGSGERTFTAIRDRAGVSAKTLESTLASLAAKGVVDRAVPYSSEARPKLARYHVADPYLRFWLRFLGPSIPALERGRGDIVIGRVRDAWQSFAGRAIEPLARAAIELLLPDPRFGGAAFVGGFWNRDGRVEVDLVGGRGEATSDVVDFVGSVKWRDRGEFGRADLGRLVEHRAHVPGVNAETRLVGVSRTGFSVQGLDVELGADEIVAAFARPAGG
ncbi:MAG: DUF234 domain-containing protein, partial [Actinomycetota bacterium]